MSVGGDLFVCNFAGFGVCWNYSEHRKRNKPMPNIVEITDLSAPELDVYALLT